jgi:energy-converting hydrogenase Eha subunit A
MRVTTESVPSDSKKIELVRVPGQFDRVDQDLVVATPTCCCCCCCLVTTFSVFAYSSGMIVAETRKQNDSPDRRFWLGVAGFMTPILSGTIASLLFNTLSGRNLIAKSIVGAVLYIAAMVFLSAKASRNTRDTNQLVLECVLFILIAAVCFAGELFSIGFLIYGQLAALFVPFLVGRARGFKGVDKTIAMAHRNKGTPSLQPPDGAQTFPAFPTYVPPTIDTPPSTDL